MSPTDESSTFTGSVTRDICNLKLGDDSAARHLCERYLQRLVSLARGRIKATRRRDPIEDEEDAALNALKSLCLRAADGRFPDLRDREDLWRLLIVITMRKVSDQTERANAQMRARDRAVGDTALGVVPGDEPPPEVVVGLIDAYDRLRGAQGRPRAGSSTSAWRDTRERRFPRG